MNKPKLGYAITGSFCTLKKALDIMSRLSAIYDIYPIFSFSVAEYDTRFFKCADFRQAVKQITPNGIIDTIQAAETLGPNSFLDAILILPCTGNTLAKMALGITDTPVTMAVKAHSRNQKPSAICLSTNDGLTASLKNISTIYSKKHFYICPMSQDDPIKKPHSLVFKDEMVEKTVELALCGKQIQPIF